MRDDLISRRLGEWRLQAVIPHIRGSLVDIGCGDNDLVARYDGPGQGVDVKQWGAVDVVVESSASLPFDDDSVDTATIIASLNYLDDREACLRECYRILAPGGRLVVTTISERVGAAWSRLRRLDDGWGDPLTLKGKESGMSASRAKDELSRAGFRIARHQRFMLGVNSLIVAEKPS